MNDSGGHFSCNVGYGRLEIILSVGWEFEDNRWSKLRRIDIDIREYKIVAPTGIISLLMRK